MPSSNKKVLLAAMLILLAQSAKAAPAALGQGVQLYNQGKYSSALPVLEAAVRANPYDPSAHYYLALCYQGLKQSSLARQHFEWVANNSKDPTLKAYAASAMQAGARGGGSAGATTASADSNASRTLAAAPGSSSASTPAPAKNLGKCKVIMFETSWCHYCREFAPTFDQQANVYHSSMDFQRLDAEEPQNVGLAQKYNIHSFPTLVYLDGHGNVLYNEGRGQFAERLKELTGK